MEKVITMKELETIITEKKGSFDVSVEDGGNGISIDMLCTSCRFDKATDGRGIIAMILVNDPTEMHIDVSAIEVITIEEDGKVIIMFNTGLPDLVIVFRE